MESRSIASKPDVAVASTSPRVTPTPPRAARFSEVLSRTVVRGAETAMRALPGSPLMAVAVRGGAAGAAPVLSVPMSAPVRGGGPEGPVAVGQGVSMTSPVGTAAGVAAAGPGAASGPVPGVGGDAGGVEASLAQSQEMNLYYLQIQEQVNAQNRSFTTLSNVLKAEHETVKTAIGNIR